MMVLRHLRPPLPATTVVTHAERNEVEEDSSPIDLSNKPSLPISEVPRNINRVSIPSHHHHHHRPGDPSARTVHGLCRTLAPRVGAQHEGHWREGGHVLLRGQDDENSMGEDDDYHSSDHVRQNFIPLSRIHARYHQRHEEQYLNADDSTEDAGSHVSPSSDSRTPDKVLTKRARLDCLISHIKQSKPLNGSGRNSEEGASPPGHGNSYSDDNAPTSLRNSPIETPQFNILGMDRFRIHGASEEEEEPCNLACPKQQRPPDPSPFDMWKKGGGPLLKGLPPLSPTEAAKAYGMDPETYQQHMMQLQLTSAAMIGDSGGFMKAMQGCPPWFLLNYYSHLLHNIQAQEMLRQYAIQSNNTTSTVIPEEQSPSTPRSTLGASGYNCQSPLSPASLSEGQLGGDSDGGSIGQMTPGSLNGKRAPRAMTGRHVRTGTGASPATLQTLRLKIEERQRLKAQQLRSSGLHQSVGKVRNGTVSTGTNFNNNSIKLQKKSKK